MTHSPNPKTLKVTMKQTEKLNNGKYLMTLSFGEVLAKDTAKEMVGPNGKCQIMSFSSSAAVVNF